MNYENVANFVTKLHVYLENRIFVCKSKIEAIIEHDWAQGNLYVWKWLKLLTLLLSVALTDAVKATDSKKLSVVLTDAVKATDTN